MSASLDPDQPPIECVCPDERAVQLSDIVNPLLTDMYQITMCYGYFTAGRHETPAVFDMFFRKNPFEGEFTIFAGLSQVLAFIESYKFEADQIAFLRSKMPNVDEPFWEWLAGVNCKDITIHAFKEGSVVFPREPLIRIEGPIGVCQLLETTLLCIVNYASLVATNAKRIRVAAGENKTLLEMGLRRAQGPDGALSASRYAHIGGFNSTSNLLAGKMFNIAVSGTHAHAFVQSFSSFSDLKTPMLRLPEGADRSSANLAGIRLEERDDGKGGKQWYVDFVQLVQKFRKEMRYDRTNNGELAAFIAYCQAFPTSFLALVDTYNTLESGVPNFLCCAVALAAISCTPLGIRLDSGDLSALSKAARRMFHETQALFPWAPFAKLKIVASNDLSEDVLYELKEKEHEIDTFGIGTHLVTCQAQPALGCVYKLVETSGNPRIKLSQEMVKVSVPGKKLLYRFYERSGKCLADVMMAEEEVATNGAPKEGERFILRHPLDATKRAVCVPARVVPLLHCVWKGELRVQHEEIQKVRQHADDEIKSLRFEHVRHRNPLPYKVSLSQGLFRIMHDLWEEEAPIKELDGSKAPSLESWEC